MPSPKDAKTETKNIRIAIEYDGSCYKGWQIQAQNRLNGRGQKASVTGSKTIQGTLEAVLKRIFQEKVRATASGRTDSGVHAFNQTVNFRVRTNLSLEKIKRSVNCLLPGDIALKKISRARYDFHSCHSVVTKVYRYFILNSVTPSVFYKKYSWRIPYKLDIPLMQREAQGLSGRHNFKAFRASGSNVRTSLRTVKSISVSRCRQPYANGSFIKIDIEADGFLYKMVRNIIGTLVEIGRGRFPPGSMEAILMAKDRKKCGPTAPAHGLFLLKSEYK